MPAAGLKRRIKDGYCIRKIRKSEFFREDWYRLQAGLSPEEDAAAHYYREGWRLYDPSPRFPRELYYASNPDVRDAGICPLAHYLLYGRIHHRVRYPGMVLNQYRARPFSRGILRILSEARYAGLIRGNRSARILVIAHIFYIDSIPEIIQYLKNLRKYNVDLVVTTVEGPDAEEIGKRIRAYDPGARVRICPNRGFDIGPFWKVLGETDLTRYDLVFKLQSKRHFSREGCSAAGMYIRGRDWFLYLFQATVGAGWVHRNVDRLKNGGETDLIAAECLLQRDPPFRERIVRRTLADHGLYLPEGYRFAAGSCFAVRAEMLRKIREAELEDTAFESAERGRFSLAHAMERYISGAVPPERQLGNPVCRRRQRQNLKKGKATLDAYWERVRLGEKYGLPDEFIQDFLESYAVHSHACLECEPGGLRTAEKEGRLYLETEGAAAADAGENWRPEAVINQAGEVLEGADFLRELAENPRGRTSAVRILRLETDIAEETGKAEEKGKERA